MAVVQSNLSGLQAFINELDKSDAKVRQAKIDAQNAERENLDQQFRLGMAGLGVRRDPVTGEQKLFNIAPENNEVLKGVFGSRAAANPDVLFKDGQIILDPAGPKAQRIRQEEEAHESSLMLDALKAENEQMRQDFMRETDPERKRLLELQIQRADADIKLANEKIRMAATGAKVAEGTAEFDIARAQEAVKTAKLRNEQILQGIDFMDETFDARLLATQADAIGRALNVRGQQIRNENAQLQLERDQAASKFDQVFIDQKIMQNDALLRLNEANIERVNLANKFTDETFDDRKKAIQQNIDKAELDYVATAMDMENRNDLAKLVKTAKKIDIEQGLVNLEKSKSIDELGNAMKVLQVQILQQELQGKINRDETEARAEQRQILKNKMSGLSDLINNFSEAELADMGGVKGVVAKMKGVLNELDQLGKSPRVNTAAGAQPPQPQMSRAEAIQRVRATIAQGNVAEARLIDGLNIAVQRGVISAEDRDQLLQEHVDAKQNRGKK